MKYLLLIRWDEKAGLERPAAEDQAEVEAHQVFHQALGKRMLDGARLKPASEAARLTLRAGKTRVIDGPFAEAKEVLGGYYLIECADRKEALEWAAKCPSANHGTLEVHPLWER